MIGSPRRPPVGSTVLYLGGVVGAGRLRVLRNTAGAARRAAPWRVVAQVILVVPGVVLFILALTVGFAVSLGSADNVASARSQLSMLLLIALVACFSGTLSTTLQSLYISQDIRFLLTLPVPLKTLFLTKVPDLAIGAIPGGLLLISITVGQLLGRAAPAAYVPFALATMFALTVIGLSMSSMVTAIVVRAAPAKLTRVALLLVSAATVLGVGLLWQRLAVSSRQAGELGREEFMVGATSLLNYTPAGWAGTVLAEATVANYAVAAAWLGLLVGVSLLCLAAASMVFATTYTRTFDLVENAGGGGAEHRAPAWSHLLLDIVPLAILPWVKREWMLMARDLRRLSAAIWPISTLGAYLIAALVRDAYGDRAPDERFWLTYGAMAALPWAMSVGSVMFATGAEGREIALLRSLPVRARTVIAGKLFAYLVPILVVSVAAVILVVAPREGFSADLVTLVLLTVWVAFGTCLIDFGGSSIAPNFEVEHIQRSTGMLGRVVSTLAGGLFLVLTVAGAANLPGNGGAIGRVIGVDPTGGHLATAAIFLAIAAMVPMLMLVIARDRYRKLLGER